MSEAPAVATGWKAHVVAGALIFAFALAFAISWGWDVADESWFLHVANRVASGEILYRDVFLHVTPLSAYIIALLTKVFGAQIMVFKAANALVFAGAVLLACRIDEQLGSSKRYSPLFLLALFIFGSPARLLLVLFYSQVANFFLLATFSLWLSWRTKRDNRLILGAGIALGLCFAAKQNVGAYGAVALVIATTALAWGERKGGPWATVAITRAGLAAAVAAGIVLFPVALSGGLPRLVEFGFSGMGSYLTIGGMWYFKPLYSLVEALGHPSRLATLRSVNAAIPFLMPFILLPMLAGVYSRTGRAECVTTIAVGAFAAAAMATLYPRADPEHMIFVAPMLLLAVGYCWRELTRDTTTLWIPAITRAALAGACAGLMMMTASALARVRSPEYVWSRLSHFRGPLMPRIIHDRLESNLKGLTAFPRDGRTFFLGPHAGFYYLAGGLHNPTRYDYPYAVALGRNGIAEIEGAIRDGHIARVCLGPGSIPGLKSHELEQYVRRNMVRQPMPDFCEQFTAPPAAGLRNMPP